VLTRKPDRLLGNNSVDEFKLKKLNAIRKPANDNRHYTVGSRTATKSAESKNYPSSLPELNRLPRNPRVFTTTVASGVLFSICEIAAPRWFALGVESMGFERAVKNARFLRGESILETLASFVAPDHGGEFRAAIG
jgi:hypothetical protein